MRLCLLLAVQMTDGFGENRMKEEQEVYEVRKEQQEALLKDIARALGSVDLETSSGIQQNCGIAHHTAWTAGNLGF